MAKRKETFANGEIYHIVLRSVEGIPLFKDESDYFRAIFGLYEFNNDKPVDLWLIRKLKNTRRNSSKNLKFNEDKLVEGKTFHQSFWQISRKKMVDILAFCLMPNHIHLLLKQIQDEGITQFMRKFATGYAMYFNKKYGRTGHLFQGAFRAVHIESNKQLIVVFVYIHTNPISLIFPKYKEVGIDSVEKAMEFLENYKWSSYQDYIGKKNFPSLTERNLLSDVIGGSEQVKKEIRDWLEQKRELKELGTLAIE